MNILTEKEREDVYKYWLNSSTLTNEDGLIQLAERAVLEKLAGMELPEPVSFRDFQYQDRGGMWNPFLNEKHLKDTKADGTWPIRVVFSGDQLRQAYAQGAASVLSAEPIFFYRPTCNGEMYEGPHHAKSIGGRMLREEKPNEWVPLFTLKTIE